MTASAMTQPAGDPTPRAGPPAVAATGVNKYFTKDGRLNHVLQDVSFTLEPGEFAAIIGPSGCGKSTLLKTLAGLETIDTGDISLFGSAPGSGRFDLGFVFQHLALLPWRTVLRNVLLPAEFARLDKQEAMERARHCLDVVGLAGYEDYRIREISGGMQQRVALARVLMTEARLLFLDEPFSALDELTRETIDMLFMEVCAETGTAVLMVTHSVDEAVLMSDRVFVMSPRPARIVDEVRVALERPRTRTVATDQGYVETVRRVRTGLGLEV